MYDGTAFRLDDLLTSRKTAKRHYRTHDYSGPEPARTAREVPVIRRAPRVGDPAG